MAATAPKISAIGLEPNCPAAPVGAPCAAVCVPEAPVEAALVILVAAVAERVAVEMVLLLLPVEAADTEDLAEVVLLPVIVVIERTELLTDTADELDEAETEVEAEAAEELADKLPPLTVIC